MFHLFYFQQVNKIHRLLSVFAFYIWSYTITLLLNCWFYPYVVGRINCSPQNIILILGTCEYVMWIDYVKEILEMIK